MAAHLRAGAASTLQLQGNSAVCPHHVKGCDVTAVTTGGPEAVRMIGSNACISSCKSSLLRLLLSWRLLLATPACRCSSRCCCCVALSAGLLWRCRCEQQEAAPVQAEAEVPAQLFCVIAQGKAPALLEKAAMHHNTRENHTSTQHAAVLDTTLGELFTNWNLHNSNSAPEPRRGALGRVAVMMRVSHLSAMSTARDARLHWQRSSEAAGNTALLPEQAVVAGGDCSTCESQQPLCCLVLPWELALGSLTAQQTPAASRSKPVIHKHEMSSVASACCCSRQARACDDKLPKQHRHQVWLQASCRAAE